MFGHLFSRKASGKTTADEAASTKQTPRRRIRAKGTGKKWSHPLMQLSSPESELPFPRKDEGNCTDILVRSRGADHWSRDGPAATALFETLQKDEKASIAEQDLMLKDIRTTTISLPGFRFLEVEPEYRFSRMRNFKADAWRRMALERADAFVYHVEITSLDDYLSSKDWYNEPGWEGDRNQLSFLLCKSSLRENPKKPLVLLVNNQGEEELDVGRLVHLLGLGRLSRPFRAIAYNSDVDVVKEALEWTAAKVRSAAGDEGTTATECETEDESSIATGNTAYAFTDENAQEYVLDYEPTLSGGNATLQRFEPIKSSTPCPFARAAKLWGGKLADETIPKQGNSSPTDDVALLNAGPLAEFVARVSEGEPLDGFCLEIPASHWLEPKLLGQAVFKLLTKLGESDPTPGENAMKTLGPIDSPRWRFRFAGEDFFLTTFSSAYGEDSSRYSFGVRKAFILFQPLTSFGRHGLTHDTPASATRWDEPASMRDKARAAFRNAGCPYHIPEELPYPVAEHVVKPAKDNGKNFVRWWEPIKSELDERDEESSDED